MKPTISGCTTTSSSADPSAVAMNGIQSRVRIPSISFPGFGDSPDRVAVHRDRMRLTRLSPYRAAKKIVRLDEFRLDCFCACRCTSSTERAWRCRCSAMDHDGHRYICASTGRYHITSGSSLLR